MLGPLLGALAPLGVGVGSGGEATYSDRVLQYSPLGYWKLDEVSGTTAVDSSGNGHHGTYASVLLDQVDGAGPTMGRAPYFNGLTGCQVTVAPSILSAINVSEGTMMIWFKAASSTLWTSDNTDRLFFEFGTDLSNRCGIAKTGPWMNYDARGQVILGGVTDAVNYDAQGVDWFCFVITWSKSADQMKFYVNGAQVGATQTALGTYSGTPTVCYIGRFIGGGAVMLGYGHHAAIWTTALSASAISDLSTAS